MNQAETQFKLNDLKLQFFNDEGVPEVEPTVSEPPVQGPSAPAATEPDSGIDYSAFGNASTDQQLELLKKHGFYGNQEPAEPKQDPESGAELSGQPQDPEVEIKVSGEVKKVKLSEALNLAQMGFDYTQKTQSLAAKQRQLDAILAVQAQSQPKPDPVKQAEQEYQAVVAQAEKELGLQSGQFNQFDPVHQFAFNRVTMTYNSQKLAQQAVQQRVNTFMHTAQTDPVAQQVDANFDSYIYRMGAEGAEGAQRANALLMAKQRLFSNTASMQDLDLLEGHWNAVKAALSAPAKPVKPIPVQQQKQKQEPPRTESPGSSVEPPRVRMDYKKLGRMKQSDQLEMLSKAGFFKRDKT